MEIGSLPWLVLQKIFSYLTSKDLIRLTVADPTFNEVIANKSTFRNLKFQNDYVLEIERFTNLFHKNPACEHIVSLNITSVYWIPAVTLRQCIRQMVNLEALHVVDTKLGLNEPDMKLYRSIPKLSKLSVAVSRSKYCKEAVVNCPALTFFYVHFDVQLKNYIYSIVREFLRPGSVKELWLIESGLHCNGVPILMLNSILNTLAFYNIDKYVSSLMNFICHPSSHSRDPNRTIFYSNALAQYIYETCEDGITSKESLQRSYKDSILDSFGRSCPFSVKQNYRLLTGKERLDDILFDEINFSHNSHIPCSESFVIKLHAFLRPRNLSSLRKLALNYCAYFDPNEEDRRVFSDLARRATNLEELELWSCPKLLNVPITDKDLEEISNLVNLKSLTLDNVPVSVTGSSLVKIGETLKLLTSLRIHSGQQNSRLHNYLCLAVERMGNLKDLRYEHPCTISIDRLFESLSKNRSSRIERVFVKCKSVLIFSAKPFMSFVRGNDRLKFFGVIIKSLPKTAIQGVKNSLEKFKEDRSKVFVVAQDEFTYTQLYNLPLVHVHDMIKYKSRVSTVDIFNDFDL